MNLQELTTSYYVFDAGILQDRVSEMKRLLPEHVNLCYAVKANPFVIKEITPFVERLEVCSPGENVICDTLGVPGEKIVISGVYKSPEFIEELIKRQADGAKFIHTVESYSHLVLLDQLSKKYQVTLSVLIRLTNNSQFGVDEASVLEYKVFNIFYEMV